MSEDNVYQDAEIVWVKLRSCWWPGEVCSHQRQPEGLLKHTKRKPYCVVKFFQEDSFEYVKNSKMIYPFNCSKKDEFIRKGHALLAKNKYMEQFPAAVSTAERLTRSVTRSSLFFNSRPDSIIKAILTDSPPQSERIRNGRQCEIVDKILQTKPSLTTGPSQSPDLSPTYKCSMCEFQSTRQNVMVLHRRSHSGSGSTPNRNSIVRRSIINSSDAKGLEKSPGIVKENDEVSKATLNKVIDQSQVDKEIHSPHVAKDSVVSEIESNMFKIVSNKNLAKERSSNENCDTVATVFIRPPPKKQLNFINCKSENIQKTLLADWIDEEKEDEDENEDEAQQYEPVEIITTVKKINQYSSISLASTSASAEKLRNQESVDQKTSLALIEPQKPTSKIRNIPKKDRRNIVFTDFNETEDISHGHSQLQKPSNDVCSQIYFKEENDPSKSKASIDDLPVLAPITVDLIIEEPLKTSTNTEAEISTSKKVTTRGQKNKPKLTDEDSSRPSNKGKLPERKSVRHETKVSWSADVTSCQLTDLQAVDEDKNAVEACNVHAALTMTVQEPSAEKYISKEESNTLDSAALVESDALKLSAAIPTDDLSAEKGTSTEQSTNLSALVDAVIDETITLESKSAEVITIKPSVEESRLEPEVELTSVKINTGETTIDELSTVENTSKLTAVQLTVVYPIAVESNTEETTTPEPTFDTTAELNAMVPNSLKHSSVAPNTVERSAVQQTPVEISKTELASVEPSVVEISAVYTSTVEPLTIEPSAIDSSLVEPSTEGPSKIDPATVESSTVDKSSIEPSTLESSKDEPSTVQTHPVEPSAVEPITVESIASVHISENISTLKPITKELTAVQPNILERNIVEHPSDESNVLSISLELSELEVDIADSKTTVLKTAEIDEMKKEKESNTEEPIVVEQSIVDDERLEPVTEDFLTNDVLFEKISPVEFLAENHSSINPTADKKITVENVSLHEVSILQVNTLELNPTENITDISSNKATPEGLLMEEIYSDEKPSSSKKQLKKTFNKKTLEQQPLLSPKKEYLAEEIKVSDLENKLDDKILKEKCSGDWVNSVMKSSDEVPKVNTYSESENVDIKKVLKEKKPALRSSTPRGCKRDTSEAKECFVKKRTTKVLSKKIKLMDKNEEETIDPSFETCKAKSLTSDQSLPIQKSEDEAIDKTPTDEQYAYKVDFGKSDVEENSIKSIFETDKTESSLATEPESVNTDVLVHVAEPSMDTLNTSNKSDVINFLEAKISTSLQSTESKSHVPVYLELEDATPVSELNESKTRSSFSKASLACFDFNEEEDILTSIANFKKTYVSPEKSYNFCLDSGPKTPDAQKLELEMKDKQLSADIESLLKTTTLPVNLASSSTASVSNRPFSNEVRGLPIKERGKRIFKSRNRLRVESCPSVSTTTSTNEVKSMSSSLLSINKKDATPNVEIVIKKVVQTQDIKNQDSVKENIITSHEENVDSIKIIEAKTLDEKVTNSEDVIVGRIMFSPAEPDGTPTKEFALKESEKIRESLVSSSVMELNTEALLISNENVEVSKNDINEVVKTEKQHFENSTCESEDKNIPNDNLLASYIEPVDNENKNLTEKVRDPESNSTSGSINEHVEQIEGGTFNNDLKKDDDPENKSFAFVSSIVDEVNQIKYFDDLKNIESKPKLLDEQTNFIEDGGNTYAEENNEPVYDKVMPIDEETSKANDSNCESPFEYELVTTEVSTLVDHISTEDQNLENAKESSTEVTEEVVSCCDDGTFLNEMIIADVTESQSSVTENENENSTLTLKYIETESGGVVENPTDESNSCSNNEMNLKIYAGNEENEIHDAEDERLQTEVEHAASSDDSSSIISDAEAEFGSPTSMLEEERVLNRAISGIETPAASGDGKGHRTLKKSTRKIRYQLQNSLKENKLIIHSLQCDTQESTSNDIVNELVYDANKDGSEAKERLNSFSNKPHAKETIEKETDSQENNKLLEKSKERLPENEKDTVDSNYDNSDSSDEDEEEICSPPIEPLLDEDTEAETIENYSTTTSLSKSEGGPQIDCEAGTVSDILPQLQLDHSDTSKIRDRTTEEHEMTYTGKEESAGVLNVKQSDSYYTITQKSDTIIKLNKQKEKATNDIVDKGWTETNVDVRKSELAGEELSAAEALLLIPNQATNLLENSTDDIKKPLNSADSLAEFESSQVLLAEEEIKEETSECSEPNPSQDLELDTKGHIPKELVRRKRRSHMKVTPRKRIINDVKLELNTEETHIEPKVAKLTNSPKTSGGTNLVKSSESADLQNKSFEEQYEDNFVLKYMKEQLIEEMELVEASKIKTEDSDKSVNLNSEKQTLEKVHITVDISNPLSSQIATILGTNRPSSTEIPIRSGVKKRKQSVEDDIPSFIIKRPCPKTIAEEEAADRETIAQIQNLCPQVEITRKSSKDDQSSSTPTSHQPTCKPQIINQQILRAGNNQPLITVTPKGAKPEEGIFDISNMPIVLSNEKMVNEKVHLVITPTTNPQIIKQFQNQQQTQLSNTGTSVSNFSASTMSSVSNPGIPVRRTSCVRTKRTPSKQQLPEQQQISEIQNFEQENYQQSINVQQQPHQQQEYVHPHQQLQHQQLLQEEHNQMQQQNQNQQEHVHPQNQFQQQLQQQQFHHQNQIQQQLQEEQNILIQQHHQLMLQQQLQLQQQQHQQQQHQQLQNQHQLVTSEKASQSNLTEKQIGIDNRGNKYVIIRNPSNTVVMANSPEPCKVPQQRIPGTAESCDQSSLRKQRQKKLSPLTVQTGIPAKSPLPVLPPLPDPSPPPHIMSITSSQTNQPQQYFKDQQIISPSIPVPPTVTTKPKGRGRGRPPKNKTETVSSNKQSTSNNVKVNANGRRSTGRICEPPRQRSTRSLAVTTSSEVNPTVMSSATVYPQNQQQTQSVGFMINPQFTTMPVGSSPGIHASNESYQTQTLGLSPQSRPSTAPGISIDASEVSGGGYAVPSLPVPGYPQTYLLCELIGNKYKEVFAKPLYLSPDRTRFLEVPDELVTEAHKKLSDSRREPNPNALKLVSDGTPHILQSRLIEINSENMVTQTEGNGQQNEVLMQKHQQLSVEEQASALLCLQEQLTQGQLVQERLVQDQLVQEQLVQEQFVEEQFVQEQFVQEQFVQEQFVQEQFVQEQFVQEQFVQEQFVQEQFVPEQFVQEQFNLQPQQFSLQLARFETGEVIEDAERGQMMVVTTGTHNMILDDKSFFEFTGEKKIDFYNAEKDTYVLTPQVISSLLHHYALGHITAVPALNTDMGDQQEVSIADVIQNADSSTNILEVALDESGLYSEDQFINTGQILQIETPEGMQLIGTAAENADLIFHHMTKANTNETNVLLNQAPKMSAVEIPSDKSKRRFETKPSTPATLEDCLNVIGVPIQSPNVPTSLELPASVTNPAIVAKTRTPTPGTITMNEIIATGLCHHPDITSLPSMSSNDQELSYEFFQSNTEPRDDKDQVNEESVVTDMGEYAVVTSSASFDDPGR